MSFEQLGLRAELLGAVSAQGYTTPTPIQAQAIPVILKGRDVLAGAQTGTGKTAAFTLPMLQHLSRSEPGPRKGRRPRALVLTPTRELAAQVAESVDTLKSGRGVVGKAAVGRHDDDPAELGEHLSEAADTLAVDAIVGAEKECGCAPYRRGNTGAGISYRFCRTEKQKRRIVGRAGS